MHDKAVSAPNPSQKRLDSQTPNRVREINPFFRRPIGTKNNTRLFNPAQQCRWNTAQTSTKNRTGPLSGYYNHAEIKTSSRFRLIPFDLQHNRPFLTRIQHRDKKVSYPSKRPHKDKSQKIGPAFRSSHTGQIPEK